MSSPMLTRILHTASFRLAILYAFIFALSAMFLLVSIFYGMTNSLEEQLKSHISMEARKLLVDYYQDGLEELRHDIQERRKLGGAGRLYYGLKRADGKSVFDDITRPQAAGWHRLAIPARGEGIVHVTPLHDGYTLYVAGDRVHIQEFQDAFINNAAMFLAAILLLSALGGAMVSRRFLARVDRITHATQAIGRDSLSHRLPVSIAGDEFDHLCLTINALIGRMEILIEDIKNVTGSIAHDLRTPLARVRQYLERIAADGDVPAPAREDTERAIELLDETLRTFGAILHLAELESGAARRDFVPVELKALLLHAADAYLPEAEQRQLRLHVACPDAPRLQGNAPLLMQLMVNLLDNAVKFCPPGSSITLEAGQEGAAVFLAVSDTGPGVAPEHLEDILKPFFRADKSRHTAGSGLGLSLVRAIASLHGGHLRVENLNPGLRVQVTFGPAE